MCPPCSLFSDLIFKKLRAKTGVQTAHTEQSNLFAEVIKRDIKGILYICFMLRSLKLLELIISGLKTCLMNAELKHKWLMLKNYFLMVRVSFFQCLFKRRNLYIW